MTAASPTPPRVSSADLRALADDIDRDPGLGWLARLLCVAVLRGQAERQDWEARRS